MYLVELCPYNYSWGHSSSAHYEGISSRQQPYRRTDLCFFRWKHMDTKFKVAFGSCCTRSLVIFLKGKIKLFCHTWPRGLNGTTACNAKMHPVIRLEVKKYETKNSIFGMVIHILISNKPILFSSHCAPFFTWWTPIIRNYAADRSRNWRVDGNLMTNSWFEQK